MGQSAPRIEGEMMNMLRNLINHSVAVSFVFTPAHRVLNSSSYSNECVPVHGEMLFLNKAFLFKCFLPLSATTLNKQQFQGDISVRNVRRESSQLLFCIHIVIRPVWHTDRTGEKNKLENCYCTFQDKDCQLCCFLHHRNGKTHIGRMKAHSNWYNIISIQSQLCGEWLNESTSM